MNDINEIVKRLQACYHASGLSYADLARRTGLPKSALQRYVSGTTEKIPMDRLAKLAYAFDTTPQELMGWDPSPEDGVPKGFVPLPHMNRIPLVGRIACGTPITAEENIEDYVDAPGVHQADFALLCRGDSMIDAGITDGDIVYIRKQPDVENGQIAAVRIGDEATLKRVYKEEDRVVLMPANSAYPPLTYVGEQINTIAIEGRAVGFTHWFY